MPGQLSPAALWLGSRGSGTCRNSERAPVREICDNFRQLNQKRKPLSNWNSLEGYTVCCFLCAERRIDVEQLAWLKHLSLGLEPEERFEPECRLGICLNLGEPLQEPDPKFLYLASLRCQPVNPFIPEEELVAYTVLREGNIIGVNGEVVPMKGAFTEPDLPK